MEVYAADRAAVLRLLEETGDVLPLDVAANGASLGAQV